MSRDNEDILRLIDLAYRSVEEPANWEVFLEELANASGLQTTSLSFRKSIESDLDMAMAHAIEPQLLQEYHEHIDAADPYAEPVGKLPLGVSVGLDRSVVPRQDLLGTKYHDWMQRCRTNASLTALHKTADRGEIALSGFSPLGELTDEGHLELFETIAPHVFHAISLSRQMARLEVEKRLTRDALARADFGCVIVDSSGAVDFMNRYARHTVERADAMELDGKTLRAAHPESRATLATAIQTALGVESSDDEPASDPKPIFTVSRTTDGHPIEVLVSPLRPLEHPLFGRRHGALVMFSDTEHLDEGLAGRLQEVYDLTPTESEVAQWLMAGCSTGEVAEIFGNSVHTIRTHVKRLLKKCDASSQVELVGLLQRSLVRLA